MKRCTSANLLADNLSVNKNTAQYKTPTLCLNCGATNAVDGNINTCTMTTDIGLTTSEPDHYTWWYVDLGDVHSVHNIRIQFKDYVSEYCKQTFIKYIFEVKSILNFIYAHACSQKRYSCLPLNYII